MLKYLSIIGLILFSVIDAKAQRVNTSNSNPFSNLQFINSATDTITLIVAYNNSFGKISDKDNYTFTVIDKQSGKTNFKNFNYAIGFTIPGYPQKFYAPCKDNTLFNLLSSRQNAITKLKVTCVVYRFYYIDDTCNFFCINKASIVD